MRVLKVIHGYPPYYMAGSEVYSYNLVNALKHHGDIDVTVFTRVENPFVKRYDTFEEEIEGVKVIRVNKPQTNYRLQEVYLDDEMDDVFRDTLKRIKPEIVHFGHVSHLSSNLPIIAKEEFNLSIVYTLDDFWLKCPSGQLLHDEMTICSEMIKKRCMGCLRVKYKDCLTEGVYDDYMNHMERMMASVDVFLSPSVFLRDFFVSNGIPEDRISHSPYGFNKSRISYRKRRYDGESSIKFAFLGRIIPSKGVVHMIDAFKEASTANSTLDIFGDAGKFFRFLTADDTKVRFRGQYDNSEIDEILDSIDVLIVPSIWYENSPLVIQEAFLAGIPVITADIGGMAELVQDGVDGFTYGVGNKEELSGLISRIDKDPTLLNVLNPNPSSVRSIEDDASSIIDLYGRLTQ